MGEVGFYLSVLFPIFFGVYLILTYRGYITPKFKNEKNEKRFYNQKEKFGKAFFWLGIILIIVNTLQLIFHFFEK